MSKLTGYIRSIKADNGSDEMHRAIAKAMQTEKEKWGKPTAGRFSPSAGFDSRCCKSLDKDVEGMGGSCALGAYAKFIGAPTDGKPGDPDMWELAKLGGMLHDFYQKMLIETGVLTDVEGWIKMYDGTVAGRVDGVFLKDRVAELKTCSNIAFGNIVKNNAPQPYHKVQMQIYMEGKGLDKGVFIYINRDKPFQKAFVQVEKDSRIIDAWKEYMGVVMGWAKDGLPDQVLSWAGGKHCNLKFCQYQNYCRQIAAG